MNARARTVVGLVVRAGALVAAAGCGARTGLRVERTVVQLALGAAHTCALVSDGTAQCWGRNQFGQLADGTTRDRALPAPIDAIDDGVQLAAAGYRTCVRRDHGAISCWGLNQFGQHGDRTLTTRLAPVPVAAGAPRDLAVGAASTCVATTPGVLTCAGTWQPWIFPDPPPPTFALIAGAADVAEVRIGTNITCVRHRDGQVRCWEGDLDAMHPLPDAVPALRATSVAVGTGAACALDTAGAVQCWGHNLFGQLGDGTTTDRDAPAPVASLAGVAQLAAGRGHVCAVRADGALFCWGDNQRGQLGDGTQSARRTPVRVAGLGACAFVALGEMHTCARLRDGTVWCWGANGAGQLGDGSTADHATPVLARVQLGPAR